MCCFVIPEWANFGAMYRLCRWEARASDEPQSPVRPVLTRARRRVSCCAWRHQGCCPISELHKSRRTQSRCHARDSHTHHKPGARGPARHHPPRLARRFEGTTGGVVMAFAAVASRVPSGAECTRWRWRRLHTASPSAPPPSAGLRQRGTAAQRSALRGGRCAAGPRTRRGAGLAVHCSRDFRFCIGECPRAPANAITICAALEAASKARRFLTGEPSGGRLVMPTPSPKLNSFNSFTVGFFAFVLRLPSCRGGCYRSGNQTPWTAPPALHHNRRAPSRTDAATASAPRTDTKYACSADVDV